jgi:hypothetical protein
MSSLLYSLIGLIIKFVSPTLIFIFRCSFLGRSDGGQSGEQISNNYLAAYLAALGDQNDSGPPEKLFIDHSLPSGKTPLFGGGQRPDDPHRCDAAVRAG